jgi:hypothetical protein
MNRHNPLHTRPTNYFVGRILATSADFNFVKKLTDRNVVCNRKDDEHSRYFEMARLIGDLDIVFDAIKSEYLNRKDSIGPQLFLSTQFYIKIANLKDPNPEPKKVELL